ncbi:hypothetical protein OH76DRAFT_1016771 [Lentinus brumalis]|uniref:Uncharacterized protein n=1 Tax=Lentinus brumalis TaxID=2498619 RepID=A0A371CY10_9APHY|nr:hypothetical protein OH76DRAFT_1016771 [Polyporus brumalis]
MRARRRCRRQTGIRPEGIPRIEPRGRRQRRPAQSDLAPAGSGGSPAKRLRRLVPTSENTHARTYHCQEPIAISMAAVNIRTAPRHLERGNSVNDRPDVPGSGCRNSRTPGRQGRAAVTVRRAAMPSGERRWNTRRAKFLHPSADGCRNACRTGGGTSILGSRVRPDCLRFLNASLVFVDVPALSDARSSKLELRGPVEDRGAR